MNSLLIYLFFFCFFLLGVRQNVLCLKLLKAHHRGRTRSDRCSTPNIPYSHASNQPPGVRATYPTPQKHLVRATMNQRQVKGTARRESTERRRPCLIWEEITESFFEMRLKLVRVVYWKNCELLLGDC